VTIKAGDIICGDANEIMGQMPNEMFDAILTDPPYGVTQDDDDYVATSFLAEAYRILKPNAALMMCVGQATMREFWNEAERVGFYWLNSVVWWHRNTLSRQSRRFSVQYDPVLYFAKGDFVHRLDAVRIEYRSQERLKYACNNKRKKGWSPNPLGARCPDVWDDIPAVTTTANSGNDPKYDHKWQKPTRLFDRMVRATCNPGDMMLDPFCGSGTSLLAAKQNGVYYVGIDVDQNCVDMSKKRVAGELLPLGRKSRLVKDIFDD
jgi:site-specific DNA-methyltransferase (adenine-specific)